jgi:hypothetical protein
VSKSEKYVPDDSLRGAVRNPNWLEHWRELAQERLNRKRTVDREATDLRLRVALIDRIYELHEELSDVGELVERELTE